MKKLKTLPHAVSVALSGGVDSVVLLHFLKNHHSVTAMHYVHDSTHSGQELAFVTDLCDQWHIELVTARQPVGGGAGMSKEAYWRQGRYEFFTSVSQPVCTAHTLDDAVEWYVFTALHGEGHYMSYRNRNVVRPLLAQPKHQMIAYAREHALTWWEDPTNQDTNFATRNLIRHSILPLALEVNPGLHKMVKKRIQQKTHATESNLDSGVLSPC